MEERELKTLEIAAKSRLARKRKSWITLPNRASPWPAWLGRIVTILLARFSSGTRVHSLRLDLSAHSHRHFRQGEFDVNNS